jgi:p-cumate 2,3-dioxygenase beta subunit
VDLAAVGRADVEDFLYREAALLDEWDLDGWLMLWAEHGTRYVVPCNDTPDGGPARDLVLIDDDELRMRLRVERLNSRKAHREYPHSRTNHQVFNGSSATSPATDPASSYRSPHRSPCGSSATASFLLRRRYHYRLITQDGRLRSDPSRRCWT